MSAPPASSSRGLFREAALERMSSPERLEVAARIVRPTSWLLLVAAAIAIGVGLAACLLIEVPVRVDTNGLLLSPVALRGAVTGAGGRITALRVKPGDHVDTGQVVVDLDPIDLRRQIEAAESDVRDTQARLNALAPASETSVPLKAAVGKAEDGLVALKRQLERDAHVLAPVAGVVLDVMADPADVVAAGTDVVLIRPSAADFEPLVATLYVPLNDAKRLRAGMRADVAPVGIAREQYGSITGRIASVGAVPVTREAMVRRLKSRELAEMFLSAGPVLEVTAALDSDRATPSTYHWTSSRGPAERLTPDTPCHAAVTLRLQPLLTLLLPATRRLFGERN